MKRIPTDPGSTSRGAATAPNDDAPFALLREAGDLSTILTAVGQIMAAKGLKAPWSLPEAIPLSDFVRQHLERKAKKLRPSTITGLRSDLTNLQRFLKGKNLQEVTGADVQQWIDHLEAEHRAPQTIITMAASANGLFRRAVSLGFMRTNPCADLDLPAAQSVVRREPMLEADVTRLLAFLDAEGLAEWALCARLMRFCGLRVGDASKLAGEALVRQGDVLLLRFTPAKTRKPVEIPVFPPLKAHLEPLVGSCGPLCPVLSQRTVEQLSHDFGRLLERAGIDRQPITLGNGRVVHQISAHSLRHSFCTSLAKAGVPEHLRMRASAHSTRAAHSRYIHETGTDLHRQLEGYLKP